MKKRLALGRQEFSEVIGDNCIYVDKTQDIHRLINDGKYYFLSRPRRFGKSLLANTMKELFLGNKELFEGLWIYDKWNWEETYPVIKISFSNIDYSALGLERAIDEMLTDIAKEQNIELTKNSIARKFQELIKLLSEKAQVVILIDEYDKPIIDYLDDLDQAEENRKILKNFYSILKDLDKNIRFLFITGVSKFSKVSIFSDLNNLTDITIDENFSKIVGWTKEEILQYFPDYLKRLEEKYKAWFPDIMKEIITWYNGYSWDGISRLFNPVSIMNLLIKRDFRNYWFTTGTPTFLMQLIKDGDYTVFDIENSYTSTKILDKYDFKNINLISLLFQTGYLTIGTKDLRTGRIKLRYPNREVDESFSEHIVSSLTGVQLDITQSLLFKITDCFTDNTIDKLIEYVNVLLKNIPYTITEDSESYYHSLFYLIIKLIGFQIDAEIKTIDGRIDAVVKTDDRIFVIEFKINQPAKNAIEQIKKKKYAAKYADDNRPISLLGINFNTDAKEIDDYESESYKA